MKQWQAFAGRRSGTIAEENFICDADPLGVILVSGPDARDFLHNQLSSDIDQVDESSLQLSSYSTPKGRMLGIFRVLRVSNGYLLLTPSSMVRSLLEQLFRYVVNAAVQLADASAYFARFAVVSDIDRVTGRDILPRAPGGVLQTDSLIAMQVEAVGGQRRYLLMSLDADQAIALWQELAADLEVAGYDAWRLAEIRAGIPTIYPQTANEFVLQMANLGALGGVSFKKGCYPGQEIVARMQYLGKLKRRMFLAELETDRVPNPGDELSVGGKDQADGSGMIVDAVADTAGRCQCLYIAQIARAEAGELRLLNQPGTPIRNLDLPYPPPA